MLKNPIIQTVLSLLLLCLPVKAQQDAWLMDVGIGLGGSFYMGDANRKLYRNTNGAAGLVARYNFNPRFALKAGLAAAGVSGDSRNALGNMPSDEHYSFSRTVYDMSVQAEWGFWGYGTDSFELGRLAPYGLAGIGLTLVGGDNHGSPALCLPIGLGVRYKLADRVNLGLEWSMRFTTSDRLDVCGDDGTGLEDPLLIKGKGLKNNDSYSFTMLYLTFDMFKRPCHCNDEEKKLRK